MSISLRSNPDGSGTLLNGSTPVMEITAAGVVSLPNIAAGSSANQPVNKGQMDTAIAAAAPTTTQVLNATAGANVGAVGTYAFMYQDQPLTTIAVGQNVSASSLYYSADSEGSVASAASPRPSGTWKCMGYMQTGYLHQTVFLRIA